MWIGGGTWFSCACWGWSKNIFKAPFRQQMPHFEHIAHGAHTRAQQSNDLLVPRMTNNHREWFPWKASRLWNSLQNSNRYIKSASVAKKMIKDTPSSLTILHESVVCLLFLVSCLFRLYIRLNASCHVASKSLIWLENTLLLLIHSNTTLPPFIHREER